MGNGSPVHQLRFCRPPESFLIALQSKSGRKVSTMENSTPTTKLKIITPTASPNALPLAEGMLSARRGFAQYLAAEIANAMAATNAVRPNRRAMMFMIRQCNVE